MFMAGNSIYFTGNRIHSDIPFEKIYMYDLAVFVLHYMSNLLNLIFFIVIHQKLNIIFVSIFYASNASKLQHIFTDMYVGAKCTYSCF